MSIKHEYCSNEENLSDYIQLSRLFLSLPQTLNCSHLIPHINNCFAKINQLEQATQPTPALPLLRQTLALNPYEYFCTVLALSCELDGACRNAVQSLSGAAIPTFDLAAGLYRKYAGAEPGIAQCIVALSQNSPLWFVFQLEENVSSVQPLLFSPLVLRRNLLHFLSCGQLAPNRYYYTAAAGTLLPLHQSTVNTAVYTIKLARQGKNCYLFLTGKEGSGKRTVAFRAAVAADRACFHLRCGALAQAQGNEPVALPYELALDAMLANGVVCVSGYTPEYFERVNALFCLLLQHRLPLILLSDTEDCPTPLFYRQTPLNQIPLRQTIGALAPDDYWVAQDHFCTNYKIPPENRPDFYSLTIGRLQAVWLQARNLWSSRGKGEFGRNLFAKSVRLLGGSVSHAQSVESDISLADLIVAPETANRLDIVCSFIHCNRANLNPNRLNYGRGVTALFYGPSGTGKTMAAAALANEMGLELLKIDLSKIFDKYIGETEKRLASVFAEAKERNCILFFDEADALFSKRTEISSSHDRYANVETSFLLQSIEQYDGIVLLATNLFGNFDEAFLRRINVLVRFSMPNEAQRLLLWQQAFAGVPLAPNVDLLLLAQAAELSPAVIWAAASSATVMVFGTNLPVSFAAIDLSLKNEMEKQGKGNFQLKL